MGLIFGFLGIWGWVLGFVIIVGWEIQQYVFDTGTPEVADVIYGIVPFTILWLIGYLNYYTRNK